jgi:hypothetical protein
MLHLSMARRLKAAGLGWAPALHDFFGIPDRGLDDRVFVINDMSVDVELLKGRSIVAFNGTSEWSLDYEMTTELVWLPTEAQLRETLEHRLRAELQPALSLVSALDTHQCMIRFQGQSLTFDATDASEAYAAALLHILEQEPSL